MATTCSAFVAPTNNNFQRIATNLNVVKFDKETQKWFKVYWRSGTENNADYYSKHHYGIVHRMVRPKHLHLP